MNCRVCDGEVTDILDLGEQYVSDFRTDTSKPNKYPLQAVICEDCFLVQLKHTTPSEEMYHENYGFKSGVSNSIKDDLKDIVTEGMGYKHSGRWLDIASNDGTLLSYVPTTFFRAGIDPITKYCKEAKAHADRIVNDFFHHKYFAKEFDVVTSISCFYDMDDPNGFVAGVKEVLKHDGVWIIQQNYLLPTLQLNAVDNFCHEHLEYYTLLSMENLLRRHGLEVIDLSTSMVNGGSLRTVVARKGAHPVQESVERQRGLEASYGLATLEPYLKFAREVRDNLEALKQLVDDINAGGETVFILAASTRGATIWQSAGITELDCPYAVERNPEKVGRYFSAVGMPIISEEEARQRKPDYMIIGPWFFRQEIAEREREYLERGGKLIVPLPILEVVEAEHQEVAA